MKKTKNDNLNENTKETSKDVIDETCRESIAMDEKEKLNEIADYYIKELCKRDLFFFTYELHPIDEVNEKWIIYFVYVEKEHKDKKEYWDEVVFMLPDGTIVISENNFEEITF